METPIATEESGSAPNFSAPENEGRPQEHSTVEEAVIEPKGDSYSSFLARKTQWDDASGFEPLWMPDFLYPFQAHLVDWAVRMGRCGIFTDCGTGKAQPLSEPVLTPGGWSTMGELDVGTEVISVDGTPTKIVGIYPQGERPVYRVRFNDGSQVRCDGEHLWAVRSDNHQKRDEPWKVLSTTELRDGGLRYDRKDDHGTFSWRVPLCGPVQFAAADALPIDPYVLGVLLGDGCLTQPDVTFTVGDPGVAERVAERLPDRLRLVTVKQDAERRTPVYRISAYPGQPNEVLTALRDLGLMGKYSYEKTVPAQYLTASVADRLEIVRGLLDTDGESSRGYVQFCTTSGALAESMTELVRSLGGVARTSTKIPTYTHNGERREGRLAYLIYIRLTENVNPFALARKADRYAARPRRNPTRKIVAIEPDGTAECVCIAVDHPSQLYVTRDYAVTHNTPMQLVWAENVRRHTGKPVLIVTPLAVGYQTVAEAAKFGVEAAISRDGKVTAGITVTNYERLEKFDTNDFGGVVCDESSAIKAFAGKRRAIVTEFLRTHRYRLLGTATAAPNDYTELGTSSEALGYLGLMDMLGKFFTNKNRTVEVQGRWRATNRKTTGGAVFHELEPQQWRFKGHAEEGYWRWVASWARAMRTPSDLGFDDNGFILPPLEHRQHVVRPALDEALMDTLFEVPAYGLQEEKAELRRTVAERCEMAAKVLADADYAVAWCHLNDESRRLTKEIDGAVEVTGSMPVDQKEEILHAFGNGEVRVLVSKPSIAGWGLNWQHANRMTFFPSHSYEQYYQAVRRMWRFGQPRPVTVDVITTPGGAHALNNLQRKADNADRMYSQLVAHMRDAAGVRRVETYDNEIEVPSWL